MSEAQESTIAHVLSQKIPEAVIAPLRDRSQIDFEIEFFQTILDRSPNYVEVLRALAELYTRKGLHAQGLGLDLRLVELLPKDCFVRYNLACSLALAGRKSEAIDRLREAIGLGYIDWQHMEADPDLGTLRKEPAYLQLVRELRTRA